MKNDKGIVLISVGAKGYPYMAFNLAYSLKHHCPNIPIHLIADQSYEYLPLDRRFVFDSVSPVDYDDYHTHGTMDPGKLKVRIYKYLPFKHNLYMDVDALCLQSPERPFEMMVKDERWYITNEMGRGSQDEKINYSEWASNETIARYFKLKKTQQIIAIQSSWAYIEKCRDAQKFFKQAEKEFEKFPIEQLQTKWGKSLPDELIFSGLASKNDMNVDGLKNLMFFGASTTTETMSEIRRDYYIMSLYGNGTGRTMTPLRYWEHYDTLLFKWTREHRDAGDILATNHVYKGGIVKQYKYASRNPKTR